MKKWMILAATSLLTANAHASEMHCGYKDYFHLNDNSNPGIYIVSGYSDSDVILQIIGPRSFLIRDSYQCRTGYTHVTLALDSMNWCVLDIKDGPYINHPIIKASCNGLQFYGMDYDGFGSYSYTLNIGS